MPAQNTVINPLQSAKETLLGMTTAIEQRFGCTPRNDIATTLNSKFGLFPTRLPLNPKLVRYFCWGVGGRTNDDQNLSSAQSVLGTNMAPYAIRPFRALPLVQDLTGPEREDYAMRVVQTIDGVQYVLYYLKKIDFTTSQVQYIITDPTSNVVSSYSLDPGNLSPTPPEPNTNGVISDVADSISVVLPGILTITGQEVFESMNVIDGGDSRYSIVSEIGFVSASTESVTAIAANGNPFSYDEAILAQMVDHYTWVGQPFLSNTDTWSRTMQFSTKNLVLP